MKISPDRPTFLMQFAAWCGVIGGGIGVPLYLRGESTDVYWLILSVICFFSGINTLIWAHQMKSQAAVPPK